jgi:thiol-disulfide isomerase/thioredoxin
MIKRTVFILVSALLMLAACSPAAATPEGKMAKPTEVMMEKATESMEKPTEMVAKETAETMMEKPTETMIDKAMESPAWLGTSLTNVKTGEAFKISDFKGKVVLVENLAMWCPSCKKQQEQVKALHAVLGMNKDLVSIGLDVDSKENATDLKTYTEKNGFDWIYAVATEDITREIGKLYGAQFLNPPSTPILIIDRKGEVHPMPFGIKTADDLNKFIEPFLSGSM